MELSTVTERYQESTERLVALDAENTNLKRTVEMLGSENAELKSKSSTLYSDLAGSSSLYN